MAIVSQTLVSGTRRLVLKRVINAGNETAGILVNASDFGASLIRIDKIQHEVDAGVTVDLLWDATANVPIVNLVPGTGKLDSHDYGGLQNNAGAGITGDILITTTGVTASLGATLILELSIKEQA